MTRVSLNQALNLWASGAKLTGAEERRLFESLPPAQREAARKALDNALYDYQLTPQELKTLRTFFRVDIAARNRRFLPLERYVAWARQTPRTARAASNRLEQLTDLMVNQHVIINDNAELEFADVPRELRARTLRAFADAVDVAPLDDQVHALCELLSGQGVGLTSREQAELTTRLRTVCQTTLATHDPEKIHTMLEMLAHARCLPLLAEIVGAAEKAGVIDPTLAQLKSLTTYCKNPTPAPLFSDKPLVYRWNVDDAKSYDATYCKATPRDFPQQEMSSVDAVKHVYGIDTDQPVAPEYRAAAGYLQEMGLLVDHPMMDIVYHLAQPGELDDFRHAKTFADLADREDFSPYIHDGRLTVGYPAGGSHLAALMLPLRLLDQGKITSAELIYSEIDAKGLTRITQYLQWMHAHGTIADLHKTTSNHQGNAKDVTFAFTYNGQPVQIIYSLNRGDEAHWMAPEYVERTGVVLFHDGAGAEQLAAFQHDAAERGQPIMAVVDQTTMEHVRTDAHFDAAQYETCDGAFGCVDIDHVGTYPYPVNGVRRRIDGAWISLGSRHPEDDVERRRVPYLLHHDSLRQYYIYQGRVAE